MAARVMLLWFYASILPQFVWNECSSALKTLKLLATQTAWQ